MPPTTKCWSWTQQLRGLRIYLQSNPGAKICMFSNIGIKSENYVYWLISFWLYISIQTTGYLKKTPECTCIPIIVVICKLCYGYTIFFFLLKTEIHICKFWIQNHFCAISRGWDIWKPKCGSEVEKYEFILLAALGLPQHTPNVPRQATD